MLKSEVSIVIAKERDAVFAYLADLTKHHEWAAQRLTVVPAGSGPVAVGAEFDSVGIQLQVKLRDKVRVTEYAPPERFAFESDGDLGDYVHYFHLEEHGGGTKIIYGAQYLRGPLYQRILAYPIWIIVPRNLRHDLKRIKARLEQGAG